MPVRILLLFYICGTSEKVPPYIKNCQPASSRSQSENCISARTITTNVHGPTKSSVFIDPQTTMSMYVLKRSGRRESVHFDKITSRISKLCYGLNPKVRENLDNRREPDATTRYRDPRHCQLSLRGVRLAEYRNGGRCNAHKKRVQRQHTTFGWTRD